MQLIRKHTAFLILRVFFRTDLLHILILLLLCRARLTLLFFGNVLLQRQQKVQNKEF